MTPREAIQEAAAVAGGVQALARKIGAPVQTVWNWCHVTAGCSPQYVVDVERETGVSRHLLRPDIFPREPERVA